MFSPLSTAVYTLIDVPDGRSGHLGLTQALALLHPPLYSYRMIGQTDGADPKHGKREKTRLTESTGKLIQQGKGRIGGEFTLQASGTVNVGSLWK